MRCVFTQLCFLLLATGLFADQLTAIAHLRSPYQAEDDFWYISNTNIYTRGIDINSDGFDDLLMTFSGYNPDCLAIYYGAQNLSGSPDSIIVSPHQGYDIDYNVLYGDYNGDGRLDFSLNYYDLFGETFTEFYCGPDHDLANPDIVAVLGRTGCYKTQGGQVDFNADGFDDILCTAYNSEQFGYSVDLIFGGNPMFAETALHWDDIPDGFGFFNAVGDVNGDGVPDLLLNDVSNQGCIKVYLGGQAFDTAEDTRFEYPLPLIGIKANGDLNGDGYDDVSIVTSDSLLIYWGSVALDFQHSTINFSQFSPGHYANIFYCNINNDEYDDLCVQLYGSSDVYFYLGGLQAPTQPSIVLTAGACENGELGIDLGDMNGDGRDDVLLSDGGDFSGATIYSLLPDATHDEVNPAPSVSISNYPNPFKGSTTFCTNAARGILAEAKITIYNVKGQKVREIPASGLSTSTWDGRDASGKAVASGVYFYRLTANNVNSTTKKMLLIR